MRRVVFVNRYFHPDHSATSQLLTDLATHLASKGAHVEVITSRQLYDEPHAALPAGENVGGVSVRRVWSTRFGRRPLVGRAFDYATFYFSALFALLRTDRDTTVVAMTDPPLLSVVAALATRLRNTRLVNWIHDLFPEAATALGIRGVAWLRPLRDRSLRHAVVNVALGDRMAMRIAGCGATVVVRHNWADAALAPVAPAENELRRDWRLAARFVVGYSGNLGRAHEVNTIVAAIERLRQHPQIAFLFAGGGARISRIEALAAANVVCKPYQPRERLSESLSAADIHLVSLLPQLEGLIVPSKLYGILAVARPVIFIGAEDGEVARIVRDAGCGVVVRAGDVAALTAAIEALAADRARCEELGRRARALYESRFHRDTALAEWERILAGAAG